MAEKTLTIWWNLSLRKGFKVNENFFGARLFLSYEKALNIKYTQSMASRSFPDQARVNNTSLVKVPAMKRYIEVAANQNGLRLVWSQNQSEKG